jgi:filamentous hemagglutinin
MGIFTVHAYEAEADAFLGGPKRFWTVECTRKQGDRIRYDMLRKRFGIIWADGVIHTFYKPNRAIHKKFLNLCYFKAQCKVIFRGGTK